MGHAPAAFFFDDGDLLYGVYNATLNVMRQILSPDPDAPMIWADMTRDHAAIYKSRAIYEDVADEVDGCPHEREHVVAACALHGGIAWHGKACRHCLLFMGPYYPLELDPDQVLDIKTTGVADGLNVLRPAMGHLGS
ncbi:MAG: hypothetical protein KGM44_13310 [bacterium]|nr:hypothetical protein [bacterium]